MNSRDHGAEETPVPIPNTAVKLLSGGSTWRVTAREIGALRGYINFEEAPLRWGFFIFVPVVELVRPVLDGRNCGYLNELLNSGNGPVPTRKWSCYSLG